MRERNQCQWAIDWFQLSVTPADRDRSSLWNVVFTRTQGDE